MSDNTSTRPWMDEDGCDIDAVYRDMRESAVPANGHRDCPLCLAEREHEAKCGCEGGVFACYDDDESAR